MQLPTIDYSRPVEGLGRRNATQAMVRAARIEHGPIGLKPEALDNEVAEEKYQAVVRNAKYNFNREKVVGDFNVERVGMGAEYRYGRETRGAQFQLDQANKRIDFGLGQSLAKMGFGTGQALQRIENQRQSAVAEAESMESAALQTLGMNLFKAGGKLGLALYADYKQRTFLEEEHKANTRLHASEAEWEKNVGSKTEFNTEDIPDDIGVRKTETQVELISGEEYESPREKIPAYEVSAELYKKTISAEIAATAESISDPRLRQAWIRQKELALDKTYMAKSVEIVKERFKANIADSKQTIKNATAQGLFHEARWHIDNSPLPAPEQAKFHHIVSVKEATGAADTAMAENDVRKMSAVRDQLSNPKYSGPLDDKTRRTYTNLLTTKIEASGDTAKAANKMYAEALTDEGRRLNRAIKTGANINVDEITKWEEKALAFGGISKELRTQFGNLQENKGNQAAAGRAVRMSDSMQDEILARAKNPAGMSAREALENDAAVAAIEEERRLRAADPTAWGERYLGLSASMDMSSPKALRDSIREQKKNADIVQGMKGVSSFLNVNQRREMAGRYAEMSLGEKAQFVDIVLQELGPETAKYFNQLGDNLNGSDLISAEISGEQGRYGTYDNVTSRMVLEGQKIRKENPLYLGSTTKLNNEIRTRFKGTYSANPTRHGQMQDAVVSLYAKMLWDKGGGTELEKGRVDKNILDKAIAAVSPIIEYNGVGFEPPQRDWTAAAVSSHLRTVDAASMFSGAALPPERVKTLVNDGTLKIVSAGKNRYVLKNTRDGAFMPAAKGTRGRFSFSFDQNAPTSVSRKNEELARQDMGEGTRQSRQDPMTLNLPGSTPIPKGLAPDMRRYPYRGQSPPPATEFHQVKPPRDEADFKTKPKL